MRHGTTHTLPSEYLGATKNPWRWSQFYIECWRLNHLHKPPHLRSGPSRVKFHSSNYFLLIADSFVLGTSHNLRNFSLPVWNFERERYRFCIFQTDSSMKCPCTNLESTVPPAFVCGLIHKRYSNVQTLVVYICNNIRTYNCTAFVCPVLSTLNLQQRCEHGYSCWIVFHFCTWFNKFAT
jgi:hypothetical protein